MKEKIIAFLNGFTLRVDSVLKRFSTSSGFIVIVSLILIHCIIIEDISEDTMYILIGCLVGFLAGLLVDLLRSYRNLTDSPLLAPLVGLASAVATYFVIKNFNENNYVILGLVGFIAILLCLCAYVVYDDHNQEDLFGYMFSSLFYCVLLCSVVLGGCSVVILAFQLLIYEPTDIYKLYLILTVIAEITINGMLILSYIPKKDSELPVPKAYSIIVNKVGLWIYFGLIAILYMYLGKIIITFRMPKGKINWFASLALLFYCFFYLSCQGKKSALESFFVRYGGFIMIPILAMQALAVYIRISAYGLTSLRYLSILLDLAGIGFVVTSFIKSPVRYGILVLAAVILIGFIGPLNILDVPFRNQRAIFNDVLNRNGMLVNGNIVPSSTISEEDQNIIRSTYDFLHYADSKLENPVDGIDYSDFTAKFGFSYYPDEPTPTDKEKYLYFNATVQEIDVSGYSHLRQVNYYYGANEVPEYVAEYFLKLYQQQGPNYYADEPFILTTDDGKKLYVTEARGTLIDESVISYFSIEGFLLY
ncbi:MAG: DUF4153 domain-containing protein [Erysipelotrichaceae bacterium]|nr:DUF4153 domain-containing protein [Erysipelotrichaceae bacterium]